MTGTIIEITERRIQYNHGGIHSSHVEHNEKVVETCCPEMRALLAHDGDAMFVTLDRNRNALRIFADAEGGVVYTDLINPKHCIWCGGSIEFRRSKA